MVDSATCTSASEASPTPTIEDGPFRSYCFTILCKAANTDRASAPVGEEVQDQADRPGQRRKKQLLALPESNDILSPPYLGYAAVILLAC
jgi:hypothetical protein